MRFPIETMRLENVNRNGDWTDYEFTDTAPNAARRLWVYSAPDQNYWEGPDFALLLRSETDDGSFDYCEVLLPRKIVAALASFAEQEV